jgi:hypothetical protein
MNRPPLIRNQPLHPCRGGEAVQLLALQWVDVTSLYSRLHGT